MLVLSLFKGALERMLIALGRIHDLGHLGFRDLERIDPARANAGLMDAEHDPGRLFWRFIKNGNQNGDHKLHGRVVIVHEQNPVHGRFFRLLSGLNRNTALLTAFAVAIWIIIHGDMEMFHHSGLFRG